jgi:hypothetical protein
MNLDDLDIPVWVQRAWSQAFAKGDILFRSVKSGEAREDAWETNASIGRADKYAYAEGYRLAGRLLADHVIQSRWDTDFLVYPIAFLYRHYVELQLKRLIPDGAFLANEALSEATYNLLKRSHRLDQLWGVFEPILRQLAKGGSGISPAEIEALDSYIRQIHDIDEGSFSFRYGTTKSGAPSIDKDKLPHINIGVLAEGMEKLTAYLFGLGVAFYEEIQIKCEIENEARSE